MLLRRYFFHLRARHLSPRTMFLTLDTLLSPLSKGKSLMSLVDINEGSDVEPALDNHAKLQLPHSSDPHRELS